MPLSHSSPYAKGVIAGLVSGCCFGLMVLFAKLSKPFFSPSQLLLIRASFTLVALGWVKRRELPSLFRKSSQFVWLRSIFGGIAALCLYSNLQQSSLTLATLLADSTPIFVLIFGYCIFRTPIHFVPVFGLLLSLGGIAALYDPSSSEMSFFSLGIGLVGAASGALAYLSLKQASGKFSSGTIVWAFSAVMLLLSLRGILPFQSMKELPPPALFYLLGLVLSSLGGQLFMTQSYQVLSTFSASCLTLTGGVWALIFDVFIVGTPFTSSMGFGFAIVILGLVLSQYQDPSLKLNRKSSKPSKTQLRPPV